MSTVTVVEDNNVPVVIIGPVTSVGALSDLTDTPVAIGIPGDILQVNSAGTGFDYVAPLWVPSYDYENIENYDVATDTYTEVLRLDKVSANPGTYRITMSMLYNLNNVNTSAYFRFSMDNGNNWTEVRREAKDINDIVPQAFPKSLVHAGGDINVVIESYKEVLGDTLTIKYMEIALERKK